MSASVSLADLMADVTALQSAKFSGFACFFRLMAQRAGVWKVKRAKAMDMHRPAHLLLSGRDAWMML